MADAAMQQESAEPAGLKMLLEHVKQSRGFDFSGYKRASLERRIKKRLEALEIASYGDYQDYLEVNPDEFTDLFDTILINVTGFFRDEPAWDYLAAEALPKLIEKTPDDQAIRVWSAGCASGEEAYTVAMVLAELLGDDEFRRRVKIYATDVDEDALAYGRHATYPRDAVQSIPDPLLEKYWERNGSAFVFRWDLRRSVIFGRNDLVQDAPISRIDLLVSRNTLMYFTPETQARILGHFNFSLNETGFLFLGKSEMLLTHGELFRPESLKWRVFTKVPRTGIRDRLSFVAPSLRSDEDERSQRYAQLRDGAADTAPVAQIVLDRAGFLAAANRAARSMFSLGPADIGRPIQDLEVSYRPLELRTALEHAYEERRPKQLGRVRWGAEGRTLEVEVTPLETTGALFLGASVTFQDVTDFARLGDEYQESKHQLETAYEELQSTVEELETTNEELQSTNEELETMNEELQSTNDELEAMNDEQRERTNELDRLNMFLEGILGNLGVAVVVLDKQQSVQLWNSSATDMWGLRDHEVDGQNFLGLDIGLPLERVREPIQAALRNGEPPDTVTVEAVNRRGRTFDCTVRTLPLMTRDGERYGVVLLMSGADANAAAGPTDGSAES